ncbi:MAG TPA: hypothetical protein VE398_08720 [Acidobacteriota bacterium]|nr:hypothetical protein [Acidobacteriota bacterium]
MIKSGDFSETAEHDRQAAHTVRKPSSGVRGRPPGKRRHPDFEQITAYIRKDTHHQVKLALLRELKGRQFSDLVEELLSTWLKSRR